MLLGSICMLDVECCSPRTTVLEAAYVMRCKHLGDLVVVDDDQGNRTPLGIITDRDIVVDVLGQGLDPATTTVDAVMRKPLVVASEGEDSSQALERMRAHGVRRMPVVSPQGKLVGIITVDDVLKLLARQTSQLAEIISQEQLHEERTRR